MNDRKLPIVTQDFLQEIACNRCHKPLSVSPIRLIGKDIVCGRCPGDGLQMKPLEAFAKQFQYPCCNHKEGCEILLTFDEVTQHESNCDFIKVQCLVMKKCAWTGPRNKSKLHVETDHPQNLRDGRKKNSFTLETILKAPVGSVIVFLFTVGNDMLKISIARLDSVRTTYKGYKVLPNTDLLDNYSYKLTFSNSQNILVYLRPHTFKLEVGIDLLRSVFGNLTDVHLNIAVNNMEKVPIFEEVLVKLECPVCLESMRNGIHIGTCGHSVCENCSSKFQKCPTCQKTTLFNIRNFALENVRDSVV